MQKFTLKKILLYSIALVSGIALILSLCFRVTGLTTKDLVIDINTLFGAMGIKLSVNGFTFLSGKFPAFLAEFLTEPGLMKQSFVVTFGVLFCILSYVTLSIVIYSFIVPTIAFLSGDKKKITQATLCSTITAFVLVAFYMILAIVFNSSVNSYMKIYFLDNFELEGIKLNTKLFIPLILQGVFLIANILCIVFVKEKEVTKRKTANKKSGVLGDVINAEQTILKCFVEYKELFDIQVITSAEYIKKKGELLLLSNKHLEELTARNVDCYCYLDVADAQIKIAKLLKDYKKLLDDGIISDMDFVEKKNTLLTCINFYN